MSPREGLQNDTSINFPSSHIVLDFLLHSSSSPLIKFLFYSSNMFFLRSCSSLWTKYFPFKIRWNINILWHKRDGHLTQSVCSGDKLWREINKALMKKEWRHQFWLQTVISRWNQWISRVLRSTDGPTSLFLFIFALFSFSCWEGTGGNRIDGWTFHILGALPLIDWLWFLKNICRKDVL